MVAQTIQKALELAWDAHVVHRHCIDDHVGRDPLEPQLLEIVLQAALARDLAGKQ